MSFSSGHFYAKLVEEHSLALRCCLQQDTYVRSRRDRLRVPGLAGALSLCTARRRNSHHEAGLLDEWMNNANANANAMGTGSH